MLDNITETLTPDTFINYGKPWKYKHDRDLVYKNLIIGNWNIDTPLPISLHSFKAIVTKNKVHLLGGYDNYAIYTASINNDGTLGPWAISGSLPVILGHFQVIVTKTRVYLFGGHNSNGPLSTVYTARINSNGILESWTIGNPLIRPLVNSKSVIIKNKLYLLGGSDDRGYTSVIYNTIINDDDTLEKWNTTNPLPEPISRFQVIVTKDRIYTLGGRNHYGYISKIYTAPINNNGKIGIWSSANNNLPEPLANFQAINISNKIYLIGGHNGSNYLSTIYTSTINDDGTLGEWTTSNPLPLPIVDSQVIVTNSRVYLLGGVSKGSVVLTVCTAPILEVLTNS